MAKRYTYIIFVRISVRYWLLYVYFVYICVCFKLAHMFKLSSAAKCFCFVLKTLCERRRNIFDSTLCSCFEWTFPLLLFCILFNAQCKIHEPLKMWLMFYFFISNTKTLARLWSKECSIHWQNVKRHFGPHCRNSHPTLKEYNSGASPKRTDLFFCSNSLKRATFRSWSFWQIFIKSCCFWKIWKIFLQVSALTGKYKVYHILDIQTWSHLLSVFNSKHYSARLIWNNLLGEQRSSKQKMDLILFPFHFLQRVSGDWQ